MIQVKANILDWPRPSLDPVIWSEGSILKPEIKKFIMDFISSFAQANNFKDVFAWITEVKLVGSLTTNCYNSNSDLDIHIAVDLPKFVELEHPEMSEKEASNYLDEIRKQVDQVKAKAPQTNHPLEIYFETEFTTKASQEFSGSYSVLNDAWLKYPHIVDQNFDIEKLHPDLLNLAKETASELDTSFGEIKRDVQDIKELNETISDWPPEQRELFEKKLQKRLDELEKDIQGLVDVREDVAEKRKHYKALSEQEVRFKYLQKYFYMHVLTDLKTLLKQSPELTTKDIPVVENIMTQARLFGNTFREEKLWFDPSGKVYPVGSSGSHADWIIDNAQLLKNKYGFDSSKWIRDNEGDMADFEGLDNALVSVGWARVGDTHTGWGIQIDDLHHVPEWLATNYLQESSGTIIFEDLNRNWVEVGVEDFVTEGQKAINKALQQKRLQTASLKLAYQEEENRILVDMDDTICHELPNGEMGEPMEGVKEALTKLKEQGFEIVIFSHRANDEHGTDEIKTYLDSHEIPYDSIFQGEKPLGKYYIDDRAIHFDSWDSVLKQIENSDKTASLVIASYEKKISQDPTREQAETLLQNSKTKMLRWAIGNDGHLYMWDAYDMDHPMARAKLGVDWKLNNSGYLGERIPPTQVLGNFWQEREKTVYASLSHAYWIDPNGQTFQVRGSDFGTTYSGKDTHDGWIRNNLLMLEHDYGIKPITNQWGTNLDSRDLIEKGWIRIGDSHNRDWGLSVKSLDNIPPFVDNLLAQFAHTGSTIEIDDSYNQFAVIEWPV
jgi:hypothetical protein